MPIAGSVTWSLTTRCSLDLTGIAIGRYVVAETEDAATADAMDKINRAFPECTVQHRQTIAVAERGPR